MLKKNIKNLCDALISEHNLISEERQGQLIRLALRIQNQVSSTGNSQVTVICTHNSRRSQLGELWLHIGAQYLNLPIQSFSGGSEVTALNYRVVNALKRVGFTVATKIPGNNPRYTIRIEEKLSTIDKVYFSKVYDDKYNPQNGFIALIVCNNADQNCPIVAGADHRLFIPYVDPGHSDQSDSESDTYLETVFKIGREMLFMMTLLSHEVSV